MSGGSFEVISLPEDFDLNDRYNQPVDTIPADGVQSYSTSGTITYNSVNTGAVKIQRATGGGAYVDLRTVTTLPASSAFVSRSLNWSDSANLLAEDNVRLIIESDGAVINWSITDGVWNGSAGGGGGGAEPTNQFDYIDLNTGIADPGCLEGRMKWNDPKGTVDVCSPYTGVAIPLGKALQFEVKNDSASTIPKGTIVAFKGFNGDGTPLVEPADSSSKLRRLRIPFAVTTMDIPPMIGMTYGIGRVTRFGEVNDIDTSLLSQGLIYLGTNGQPVTIPPAWPDEQVVVGAAGIIDPTNGQIIIDIRNVTINSAFNSCAIEQQDVFLVRDAGSWYVETELVGGGDLNTQFSGDWFLLDCTTGTGVGGRARSNALTMGTDADPRDFFAWVELQGAPGSEVAVLRAGTSLPADPTPHAQIARGSVWSDTKTTSEGPLSWQRTTDAIAHNGQGRMHHIGDWIRGQNATWMSGCAPTATITNQAGLPDLVQLTTASGVVKQMHDQTWPAYDISTDGLWVANASGLGTLNEWERVTDSNALLETALGATIPNNKFFTLVYFLVVNKATSDCKLCVNLPTDYYSSAVGAYTDPSNYAITSVPTETRSTAALLCAIPYRYTNANGGTWEFVGDILGLTSVINLRGVPPGLAGTASGGAAQQFSDGVFAVFNDADSSKVINFDASGISTATTRTYTWLDRDHTIEKYESRARKWVLA